MGRGNWINHTELVRLRENIHKRKVSAEEVAEVKAELDAEKKVDPTVRVVDDKPFKPSMTIRLDLARDRGVYPRLSGKR